MNAVNPTDQSTSNQSIDQSTVVAQLELLEERAEIHVERVPIGAVVLRREVEQRIEKFEIELTREILVIQHQSLVAGSSAARVMIEGVQLQPGEELRLVLYDEQAVANVTPVVTQTVRVLRSSVSTQRTLEVHLGREVLEVDTEGQARVHER